MLRKKDRNKCSYIELFYGESKRRKNCDGYMIQLERYSHIQWECKKIQPKVNEQQIVNIIRFRSHYFKQISSELLKNIEDMLIRIQ